MKLSRARGGGSGLKNGMPSSVRGRWGTSRLLPPRSGGGSLALALRLVGAQQVSAAGPAAAAATQRRRTMSTRTWAAGAVAPLPKAHPYANHLLDVAIMEHVGIYGDPFKSAEQAVQAEPNLVLGHVLKAGLALFGTNLPYSSPAIQESLKAARKALRSEGASEREKAHLQALEKWVSKESMEEAVTVWEDILSRHPRDELAVKFTHDAYFFLGKAPEMKTSIERIMGEWEKSNDPIAFGYLLGMHAFSLVENHLFKQAHNRARSALSMNSRDTWAMHAIAHVFEMEGKQDEGIRFLVEELPNWKWSTGLACHLWWHLALHYLEQGNHDRVLNIFDHHILPMTKTSGTMLDLVDGSSLLQRIEFDGGNVGERWKELAQIFRTNYAGNVLAYNDVHLAMTLLGAGDRVGIERFVSINKARGGADKAANVGKHLTQAFIAYKNRQYEQAVNELEPFVDESRQLYSAFIDVGGSNAQRDLFAQLFLLSLGQSHPQGERKQLLDRLLWQRTDTRPSPLTNRFIDRLIIPHTQPEQESQAQQQAAQ